jgi:hypothetical protein
MTENEMRADVAHMRARLSEYEMTVIALKRLGAISWPLSVLFLFVAITAGLMGIFGHDNTVALCAFLLLVQSITLMLLALPSAVVRANQRIPRDN